MATDAPHTRHGGGFVRSVNRRVLLASTLLCGLAGSALAGNPPGIPYGSPLLPVTAGDFTGATNSSAPVSALAAATNPTNALAGTSVNLGLGTLQLGSDVYFGPATVDGNHVSTSTPIGNIIELNPTLSQTGAGHLRFDNLYPAGPPPIYSMDYHGNTYGPSYNFYANVYQDTQLAVQQGTSAAIVADAPWGIMDAATGTSVWGMNNACFVSINNGGVCYGQETDVGTTAPTASSLTASLSGTTLTVTAIGSGTPWPGQTITDTTTALPSGEKIIGFGTGYGATLGTYTVSIAGTVASETMTGVAPAAHTYGIDIHGFGNQANYVANRLTANSAAAAFTYGTIVNAPSWSPIQAGGQLFLISGNDYQSAYGFNLSAGVFTTSEWSSPNLFLGPTITNWNTATGARPALTASVNASGDAEPMLYPVAGSGNTGALDIGVNASVGGVVHLSTGTSASPVDQVDITDTPSATSHVTMTGGTSNGPVIGSSNGSTILSGVINAGTSVRLGYEASLSTNVNYIQASGSTTGLTPTITFNGSDTSVSGNLTTKGNGNLNLVPNGTGSVVLGTATTPLSVVGPMTGSGTTSTATAGPAAGTSPTVAAAGHAVEGVLSVTTGTSPSANALIATVTLGVTFPSAPYCTYSPQSATAAALGAAQPWLSATTTTLLFEEGATGLAASTPYSWNYRCGS